LTAGSGLETEDRGELRDVRPVDLEAELVRDNMGAKPS